MKIICRILNNPAFLDYFEAPVQCGDGYQPISWLAQTACIQYSQAQSKDAGPDQPFSFSAQPTLLIKHDNETIPHPKQRIKDVLGNDEIVLIHLRQPFLNEKTSETLENENEESIRKTKRIKAWRSQAYGEKRNMFNIIMRFLP